MNTQSPESLLIEALHEEGITERELTAKARKNLPDSAFVYPGERKYPIHDKAHARNALARVAQFGSPTEKARVKAAVHAKYPDIGESMNEAEDLSIHNWLGQALTPGIKSKKGFKRKVAHYLPDFDLDDYFQKHAELPGVQKIKTAYDKLPECMEGMDEMQMIFQVGEEVKLRPEYADKNPDEVFTIISKNPERGNYRIADAEGRGWFVTEDQLMYADLEANEGMREGCKSKKPMNEGSKCPCTGEPRFACDCAPECKCRCHECMEESFLVALKETETVNTQDEKNEVRIAREILQRTTKIETKDAESNMLLLQITMLAQQLLAAHGLKEGRFAVCQKCGDDDVGDYDGDVLCHACAKELGVSENLKEAKEADPTADATREGAECKCDSIPEEDIIKAVDKAESKEEVAELFNATVEEFEKSLAKRNEDVLKKFQALKPNRKPKDAKEA